MLELVYEEGGATHRVPVRRRVSLGRSSDNDVVLRDFSVSRHHARIDVEDGVATIFDLDSTNGVKVNDAFVTSSPLTAGDHLVVGSFTLLVEDASGQTDGLSSATYLRPLKEFNDDYGLEGTAQQSSSREVGGRERVFEILAQVAKTLLQVEELEPVLDKVMDVVFEHLLVDRGFIVLFDEDGEPRLELYRTRESGGDEAPEVPISRPSSTW